VKDVEAVEEKQRRAKGGGEETCRGETNVHARGQGWGWETDQRGVTECTQLKWGAHNKGGGGGVLCLNGQRLRRKAEL